LGKKNVMPKKKERKQKKMWKKRKKKYGVGKATVISPSLRVLLIMLFLKWYVEPETPWTHHLNDISEEFRKKEPLVEGTLIALTKSVLYFLGLKIMFLSQLTNFLRWRISISLN
jgi:hypothetical protein